MPFKYLMKSMLIAIDHRPLDSRQSLFSPATKMVKSLGTLMRSGELSSSGKLDGNHVSGSVVDSSGSPAALPGMKFRCCQVS